LKRRHFITILGGAGPRGSRRSARLHVEASVPSFAHMGFQWRFKALTAYCGQAGLNTGAKRG